MFTGIITDVGTVRSVEDSGAGKRVVVTTRYDTAAIEPGVSIACAGICLTVVELGPDWFGVDASLETLSLTTLGEWREGDTVNLERALKIGDELGGHLVLGHIDGVGRVTERRADGESCRLGIELAETGELARYVAAKGSVAVDGVALTVNEITPPARQPAEFEVNIVPFTLAHTSLGGLKEGGRVNLEVDMMARYAARLGAFRE